MNIDRQLVRNSIPTLQDELIQNNIDKTCNQDGNQRNTFTLKAKSSR